MLDTYLEHIYTVTEIKDLVLVNLHSCLSFVYFPSKYLHNWVQLLWRNEHCNRGGCDNKLPWAEDMQRLRENVLS